MAPFGLFDSSWKTDKNKVNQNISIKHHILVTQTDDYMITVSYKGCQLTTHLFSWRTGYTIEFNHKIFTKLKSATKSFIKDYNLISLSNVLITNNAKIISGLIIYCDLFRDVRLIPPSHIRINKLLNLFKDSLAIPDLTTVISVFFGF